MKKLIFTITPFLFFSCATTYNDFSHHALLVEGEKEGILFGGIEVEYNGKILNEKCSLCFTGAESGCYKLPQTGSLLLYVNSGESSIKSLNCLDSVEYHVYPKDLGFKTLAQQKNYLGHLKFIWKNESSGFSWNKFFNFMGAITDEKKPDGKVTVILSSELEKDSILIERAMKLEDQLPLNLCEINEGLSLNK